MTLHPWMWPEKPWQRLHIDYAGPFLGRYFLIVVDARAKWPEVIPTATITSEKTITELQKLFSTHGIPEQIVSDNGTQFTSLEFGEFLKKHGIKHMLSAPYHPATNGEAERFVQTFKHALKAARLDPGTLETNLARFLLSYRTTPNATTNVSPAELLFNRQIRTRLTIVVPKVSSTVSYKQAAQKK